MATPRPPLAAINQKNAAAYVGMYVCHRTAFPKYASYIHMDFRMYVDICLQLFIVAAAVACIAVAPAFISLQSGHCMPTYLYIHTYIFVDMYGYVHAYKCAWFFIFYGVLYDFIKRYFMHLFFAWLEFQFLILFHSLFFLNIFCVFI